LEHVDLPTGITFWARHVNKNSHIRRELVKTYRPVRVGRIDRLVGGLAGCCHRFHCPRALVVAVNGAILGESLKLTEVEQPSLGASGRRSFEGSMRGCAALRCVGE
jgi:hypothetical protein